MTSTLTCVYKILSKENLNFIFNHLLNFAYFNCAVVKTPVVCINYYVPSLVDSCSA